MAKHNNNIEMYEHMKQDPHRLYIGPIPFVSMYPDNSMYYVDGSMLRSVNHPMYRSDQLLDYIIDGNDDITTFYDEEIDEYFECRMSELYAAVCVVNSVIHNKRRAPSNMIYELLKLPHANKMYWPTTQWLIREIELYIYIITEDIGQYTYDAFYTPLIIGITWGY